QREPIRSSIFLPSPDVQISGKGNPLASLPEWVNCKCPKCGQDAKRETGPLSLSLSLSVSGSGCYCRSPLLNSSRTPLSLSLSLSLLFWSLPLLAHPRP